jgi:cell division protein FtsZ
MNSPSGFRPTGAVIKVIGVGGAGGNVINNMIRSGIDGVEFYSANTDAQALESNAAKNKIQLGNQVTRGLGAGANPDVGRAAAEESIEDIRKALEGADMVFVAAGMGGGTGTEASSVVARVAKEMGCLTVGVVTKPFTFEGNRRMKNALKGIEELKKSVDTLITIPNSRLLSVSGRNTSLLDAFRKADDVLYQAVKGISDLITTNGHVNVDFADVRAIMSDMGYAMMGTGEASGENRAVEAAQKAVSSPLLEDVSIQGARGVLINITASPDITLQEVNEAAEIVHSEAHEDANIIWGMVIDETLKDIVRVTVVATGFGDLAEQQRQAQSPGLSATVTAATRSGGLAVERIEIPAYGRKSKEATTPSMQPGILPLKKVSVLSGSEEEKFEIPAFLRKSAD